MTLIINSLATLILSIYAYKSLYKALPINDYRVYEKYIDCKFVFIITHIIDKNLIFGKKKRVINPQIPNY